MQQARYLAWSCALSVAAVLLLSACAPAPTAQTFRMVYSIEYERAFDSVSLSGEHLTFVHYEAPDTAYCTLTHPCFGDSNLRTDTVRLSRKEATGLASSVGDLHLERLPDTTGDTTGAASKLVCLTVTNARGTKTIVYRSTAWAPPPPEAYRQAATLLAGMVQRKFNHRMPVPRQ